MHGSQPIRIPNTSPKEFYVSTDINTSSITTNKDENNNNNRDSDLVQVNTMNGNTVISNNVVSSLDNTKIERLIGSDSLQSNLIAPNMIDNSFDNGDMSDRQNLSDVISNGSNNIMHPNQMTNSFNEQDKMLNGSFIESNSFNEYLRTNNQVHSYINYDHNNNNSNNIQINNSFCTGSLPVKNPPEGQYLENIYGNKDNYSPSNRSNSGLLHDNITYPFGGNQNNLITHKKKINNDIYLDHEEILAKIHERLNAENRFKESAAEQTKPSANENLINIADFPVEKLFKMLSLLLNKIINSNDELIDDFYPPLKPDKDDIFCCFYGKYPPKITVEEYLFRIQTYCPTTNDIYISLLVYFDKISKRCHDYTIRNDNDHSILHNNNNNNHNINNTSSKQSQTFVMDSYNIHRLLLAGITVGTKFSSDFFYSNSRYARVGGISLSEINNLELTFMMLLDFKLTVQIEELQRYSDLLYRFWENNQTEITA